MATLAAAISRDLIVAMAGMDTATGTAATAMDLAMVGTVAMAVMGSVAAACWA